jgi:hypothetical protein
MSDFEVVSVGVRHFIDAIRKASPNGERVLVSYYENGDWAVYGNGCYAQPCHAHEYIQSDCPGCGKPTEPTESSRG